MKNLNKIFACIAFIFALNSSRAWAQEKPAVTWKDVATWSSIRMNQLNISPDGKWTAFTSGPTKGDLTLTVKHTSDTLSYEFPIGTTASAVVFSKDGKKFAYREGPSFKESEAARRSRRNLPTKLHIVTLADTQRVTFENFSNFEFSGENAEWIGISVGSTRPSGPSGSSGSTPGGTPSPGAGGSGASAANNADSQTGRGSDFLLYHIASKTIHNIGNVSEFAFNKSGNLLAYIVDADGQNGNGVWLRDLKTGLTTLIDQDKANYKRLNWHADGEALTIVKAKKHEDYKQPVNSLIGVTQLGGKRPFQKVIYNPLDDANFPEQMGIADNLATYWSEDFSALLFGVTKVEKKEKPANRRGSKADSDTANKSDSTKSDVARSDSSSVANSKTDEGRSGSRQAASQSPASDQPKPDMIIWNWQDKRLQSAQQLQQARDKNVSHLSVYLVESAKFMQIADSNLRFVNVGPKQLFAFGYDYSPYELENNLNGQTYADIYLFNLRTGEKSLFLKEFYLSASRLMEFSPAGKHALYYKEGEFYVADLENNNHRSLTAGIPTSFISKDEDRNVKTPATPSIGWTSDSKFVIVRDNYDLWKISIDGKHSSKLTPNFQEQRLVATSWPRIYADDKGIDLKKDQYISVFDERSKKQGMAILEAGKSQARLLFLTDHAYGQFRKAENANTFFYSKENSVTAPELFVSNSKDLEGRQLTSNTPKQQDFAWSPGAKLIEYVSAHGDTLHAALYLPANYEPGKAYPTITYIYERLSQDLNSYSQPSYPGGGFNRAVYTSNGYAVLMPDIKYRLNEPGESAVACVVPAVEAAIATGIVDKDRVAIHGHSWGGYQTSFLITQTNMFKAAAAGAPLTNMISMYSLIYWNSGSSNQSIFESSQGRLTSGYWDNWEAYTRNSPIFYIKNVQTPLLLLHNDKDGAVDYTQGIEFYNGLRRLNKPVTMITYKGENHGINKEENRKDYALRMLEFMDHHLKGAKAPDWWEKGIDLIDLPKHLESRAY